MIIPMPLLLKVKVHWTRKLVLGLFFSSGAFVMIASILRSYYSLKSISDLPIALGWADREGFVAAVTVSLPGIKPLFSKRTWYPNTSQDLSKPYASGAFSTAKNRGTITGASFSQDPMDRYYEMQTSNAWRQNKKDSGSASDEEIMMSDSKAHDDVAHDIYITREYRVSRESPRPPLDD
jgi:hypothetical protein